MDNFDLKNYLKNNLINESLEEAKETGEVKEEVKTEGYGKMKKSQLREKIREEILEALKGSDDIDDRDDDELTPEELANKHAGSSMHLPPGLEEAEVEEGFGKSARNLALGALGALGIKKYGIDILNKFMEVLPEDKAQELSDIIQTLVDMGQTLFEAEEDEAPEADLDIDVDAELDIEEPAAEEEGVDPFGDVEDDVEGAEKEAYEAIIAAGRAYKKLGEDTNSGGFKTMMDQLTYLERSYDYPPKEDVFNTDGEI